MADQGVGGWAGFSPFGKDLKPAGAFRWKLRTGGAKEQLTVTFANPQMAFKLSLSG